ncbi:hypothetical protein B4U80_13217 [Leptotrombidium deliense]|uniref:Uncharacterized protein n=1 Tax=Leptotrombidium deliense TaxID=299467 RepID=A0A443SA90_9ACAR|nr:hypothetical protein B4U80_13217 [Leptotrombidium deliense]
MNVSLWSKTEHVDQLENLIRKNSKLSQFYFHPYTFIKHDSHIEILLLMDNRGLNSSYASFYFKQINDNHPILSEICDFKHISVNNAKTRISSLPITKCCNLKILKSTRCITYDAIEKIIASNNRLKVIDLDGYARDSLVKLIVESCPELVHLQLNLFPRSKLTNATLALIAWNLKHLEVCIIRSNCELFSDKDISEFIIQAPSLRVVDIGGRVESAKALISKAMKHQNEYSHVVKPQDETIKTFFGCFYRLVHLNLPPNVYLFPRDSLLCKYYFSDSYHLDYFQWKKIYPRKT